MIGGYVPPDKVFFFYSFTSLGLNQWVKKDTFVDSNSILNLVFTTELDRIF